MSREIKFRAYDSKNKYWVYSDPMPDMGFWKWVAYDNSTVFNECTGLKDKNGVEIYEGDVVRMHQFLFDGSEVERNHIGFIEYISSDKWSGGGVAGYGVKMLEGDWFMNHTGYKPYSEEIEAMPMSYFYGLHEESFEVIGNVHENPELMKDTE